MTRDQARQSGWCATLWSAILVMSCAHAHPFPTPAPAPSMPRLVAEGRLIATPDADRYGVVTDRIDSAFVVPVVIRGHTFRFIVDHGSDVTVVTAAVMDSLKLPHNYANATRVVKLPRRPGVKVVLDSTANVVITGPDTITEYWGDFAPVVFDSLRIGSSLQEHVYIGDEKPTGSLGPLDGLLGRDILTQFDLEFAVAAHSVRLYERSALSHPGLIPAWLPPGLSADDCLRPNVIGQVSSHANAPLPDITTVRPDERQEAVNGIAALERLFAATDLRVPVTFVDRLIDVNFDSGSRFTIINWVAARALGLSPTSPAVRRVVFADSDSVWDASGVELQVAGRRLAVGDVRIVDRWFDEGPATVAPYARVEPMMTLGWDRVGDRVVFFSYSTGMICIGQPAGR